MHVKGLVAYLISGAKVELFPVGEAAARESKTAMEVINNIFRDALRVK